MMGISRFTLAILATLMLAGLIPFALIARSRATQSGRPPLHLVFDMDKQPKGKAQRATTLFEDGRFMRPRIEGTLAREDLLLEIESLNDVMGTRPLLMAGEAGMLRIHDAQSYAAILLGRVRPAGMTDEQFAAVPIPGEPQLATDSVFYVRRAPIVVNLPVLQRGQERFTVFCAPCHGESGYGDGPVAGRAARLQISTPEAIGGWALPQNLHEPKMVVRPDGHLFNTITRGIRNMPAHDKQISVLDRWAIVAYVRALQRSQDARPGDESVGEP